MSKRTFFFVGIDSSPKRGQNHTTEVYEVVNNIPKYIGYTYSNTASWKGDKAVAAAIISEEFGIARDGYNITDPNVQLFELGNVPL